MPTASDYFQTPASKYFRAGDFTKELVGTIQSVDRTEFKNDDGSAAAKPVLHPGLAASAGSEQNKLHRALADVRRGHQRLDRRQGLALSVASGLQGQGHAHNQGEADTY